MPHEDVVHVVSALTFEVEGKGTPARPSADPEPVPSLVRLTTTGQGNDLLAGVPGLSATAKNGRRSTTMIDDDTREVIEDYRRLSAERGCTDDHLVDELVTTFVESNPALAAILLAAQPSPRSTAAASPAR